MKQGDFVIRSNFTKIPNAVVRDTRLSAGAKGLYVVMAQLFVIAGFTIYKSMIRKQFSDGAATFDRNWNELKKYGYLKIEKKHINGRYAYEYELFDCACDPEGEMFRSETGEDAAVTENSMNETAKENAHSCENMSKEIDSQRLAKIGGYLSIPKF